MPLVSRIRSLSWMGDRANPTDTLFASCSLSIIVKRAVQLVLLDAYVNRISQLVRAVPLYSAGPLHRQTKQFNPSVVLDLCAPCAKGPRVRVAIALHARYSSTCNG